jgi:hypothetical protein
MWKRRSLALRLEPFRAGEPHIESELEHINTIQERLAMVTTATETKPKTSPAFRQLDRTIVDGEANLVVQGASAKVVMSPAGMADGEATFTGISVMVSAEQDTAEHLRMVNRSPPEGRHLKTRR